MRTEDFDRVDSGWDHRILLMIHLFWFFIRLSSGGR